MDGYFNFYYFIFSQICMDGFDDAMLLNKSLKLLLFKVFFSFFIKIKKLEIRQKFKFSIDISKQDTTYYNHH